MSVLFLLFVLSRFPMLATKVFLITYNAGNTNFAKFPQKKNAAIEKIATLLSPYSILAGQ